MAALLAVMGQSVSMTSVFLLCVLITIMLVSALISRRRNRELNAFMASIPGPTPIPFVGTLYVVVEMKTKSVAKFLLNHNKKYPKLGAHWFFSEPYVLTDNLEVINAILASHHNTEKSPDYQNFANASRGVFSASGDTWRTTRKIMTPGFKTNVKGVSFADNYSFHVRKFVEILDEYADDGKEHDLLLNFNACVMDLVMDNFAESKLMDAQGKRKDFAQLCFLVSEMIYERILNPALWSDWMYALTGKQRKLKKIAGMGLTLMEEILEQRTEARNHLKKINPAAERPQTYMEILLSNVDSGVMAKEDALEELLELLVAASVPPAGILYDIMWILSVFPDIQRKAYQEIIENCTKDEVSLDDLPNLVYVEMIVKEALRHFTTPFSGRQLVKEYKVDDKITIPAGVCVILSTYILHHNPEFWEKPGEFYPEHFTETNERKRPRGAYVPFLSGPRSCLGNKYAMQSMTMLVANTLLHYEILSNKEPPKDLREEKYNLVFMLMPEKGHKVQIKRRHARKQIACCA